VCEIDGLKKPLCNAHERVALIETVHKQCQLIFVVGAIVVDFLVTLPNDVKSKLC